jgi:hypothetical protein
MPGKLLGLRISRRRLHNEDLLSLGFLLRNHAHWLGWFLTAPPPTRPHGFLFCTEPWQIPRLTPCLTRCLGRRFKRDENDPNTLHLVEYISLKESLLGFGHTVKHLDNHQIITTYSGVTQPYQVRKVQGEGMPIRGQGRAGDLLVEHRVRFPNQVSGAGRVCH